MTPNTRTAIRSGVIACGGIVGVAAVLAFRADDWPIYLAYLILSTTLLLPGLEVLPGIRIAIAEMAATIGFVYVAGLPIIVLHWLAPLPGRMLLKALPRSWRDRLRPYSPYRDLFFDAWMAGGALRIGMIAEWSMFSLGLAARVLSAKLLFSAAPPIADPDVILVAEFAGYMVWGALSLLPIYSDRALMPSWSALDDKESALSDIRLVVVLALTPFVYLIAYGYRLHGLPGAVGWSIGTLGLHVMLQRLHERRLRVEEQNRRLSTLNRELEHRERLSAIGKMSSIVSHQILQQLGVIGIYADLIRNGGVEDDPTQSLEQARSKATAIVGALTEVNRVLTDLLVFSRDLRLNLYTHTLQAIIEEVAAECAAEAASRHVLLRVDAVAPVDVTVDKLKLKQALLNVVRNALQASPHGGAIVLSATSHGDEVEISVADQGAGVPENDREAVFTPFFTTKEQGSGLGLAIARVFVEAHGGRIWVDPDRPRGAVFRLRLPITACQVLTA
jgi:signal transduction histidine kinase